MAEEPSNRSRGIGLASVPVALGVPLEGTGELRIALAASDGTLDEIDAAPQIPRARQRSRVADR